MKGRAGQIFSFYGINAGPLGLLRVVPNETAGGLLERLLSGCGFKNNLV